MSQDGEFTGGIYLLMGFSRGFKETEEFANFVVDLFGAGF